MVVESVVAAAWAAGVVEGVSVLSDAEKRSAPRLIVPAVLYGTLSLPLGIFGASPGPATIAMLPFGPKLDVLQQSISSPVPSAPRTVEAPPPSEPAVNVEQKDATIKRTRWRGELLRDKNRTSRNTAPIVDPLPRPARIVPPPRVTATASLPTATGRYLATLDGRPLPTALAEAMRRTRFLLIGAGIVTFALSFQIDQKERERREEQVQLDLRQSGKDAIAISKLIQGHRQGAALRICDSSRQYPRHALVDGKMASRINHAVATIPLFHSSAESDLKSLALPYWNPGKTPADWINTPISTRWLMRTKDARILVLEVDLSATDMDLYFLGKPYPNTDPLSRFMLLATSLSNMAMNNNVIKTPAIKIILGSGKPVLPGLSDNTVYVNGTAALGVELSSSLEQLYQKMEKALKAARRGRTTAPATDTTPNAKKTSIEKPADYVHIVLRESVSLVEGVGSSIRRVAELAGSSLAGIHDDYLSSRRVVHVLSDQRCFVEFLQRSLRGWRIVWYDVTKAGDVQQYLKTHTAISVVCCHSDIATSSCLENFAVDKPHVLAVVEQPDAIVPSSVEMVSIRAVHDALFAHVRELLADGNSTEEVQALVSLIQ